ncbi:hypothetical protein [Helicobacter rodentium]|nr:hypothetical protein [Helicobacter rodentium]
MTQWFALCRCVLSPRHCKRSEAIHNLITINFHNGIFKTIQSYRLPRFC